MPSRRPRRHVLTTCVVLVGTALAGCLGDTAGGDDTDETPTTSAGPSTSDVPSMSDAPTSQPVSTAGGPTLEPSVVSELDAKKRALAAESAYLESRLENASCVEQWSWYSPTSEDDATVTGRTADSVLVEVRHAYSYNTENEEADAYSNARYAVGPDEAERLSGDEVTPC